MDKYEELKKAVEDFIDDVKDGSDNWSATFGHMKKLVGK